MSKQELIAFVKNALLLFVIMVFSFLFFDLYVEIKKTIMGIPVSKEDVLESINLPRNLPVIIAITVILSYRKHRKDNNRTSSSRR
ncbi:hypothetical protein DXT99_07895 [Pontibacter diazotrophicus]|uniref:Uncharacterized protein n=1 Tax=Pontibacter diazotrophicus TaxID=1400979 RepID=A0A3D8LEP1_9BACT|nr:hypothetical protein DXT99_07895 [Pontibacter diazotrophicus]